MIDGIGRNRELLSGTPYSGKSNVCLHDVNAYVVASTQATDRPSDAIAFSSLAPEI